ncbi:MAG: sugar phosphate isomerase/epimerase [Planctomycetes bacterium]|nr:sugar phosphate isomerase/epimerase [Planctomycetota bacterium]
MPRMKTSLFSTSLTALGLREAIQATAEAGYDAIELGCFAPHLTLEMAEKRGEDVCAWLKDARLPVSALSLTVEYTSDDEATWRKNVDETNRFIRLCRKLGTSTIKTMPGRPGSAKATQRHWNGYRRAMDIIVPVAKSEGVRLAVETHLNHLSDSIETASRCIECGDPAVLGVNLDFCNVHTCHESALDAMERFRGRIFLTHVKDSRFNLPSGEYAPMGEGKMNYPPIIQRLRAIGYDGFLSVECLYPKAKRDDPRGAIAHDLGVLRRLLGIGA